MGGGRGYGTNTGGIIGHRREFTTRARTAHAAVGPRAGYSQRVPRRVYIVVGHPRPGSFCAALADAYADGARAAGCDVRLMRLGEIPFNPDLHHGYAQRTDLEPALADAQRDIEWCEHLVIAYPSWWGMPPALLKGFFDRVLLPGFAFRYREDSPRWDRLLRGRSARLLVTMDAPPWYDSLFYGGRRVVKRAVLRFCGFAPVRDTAFGPVKSSTDRRRERWLATARRLGASVG